MVRVGGGWVELSKWVSFPRRRHMYPRKQLTEGFFSTTSRIQLSIGIPLTTMLPGRDSVSGRGHQRPSESPPHRCLLREVELPHPGRQKCTPQSRRRGLRPVAMCPSERRKDPHFQISYPLLLLSTGFWSTHSTLRHCPDLHLLISNRILQSNLRFRILLPSSIQGHRKPESTVYRHLPRLTPSHHPLPMRRPTVVHLYLCTFCQRQASHLPSCRSRRKSCRLAEGLSRDLVERRRIAILVRLSHWSRVHTPSTLRQPRFEDIASCFHRVLHEFYLYTASGIVRLYDDPRD